MFDPVIKLFGLVSSSAMGRFCLLLAAISGAFSEAKALEPDDLLFHRIGNVSLRPSFQISETYNDNIFFRENEKEEDWISAVSGGAVVLLGRPQESSLLAGYEYTHNFFRGHSDQNSSVHGASLAGNISSGRWSLIPNVLFNSSASPLSGYQRFRYNPITGALQPLDELLVETSTLNATIKARFDISRKTFTTTEGRYDSRKYGYSAEFPVNLPVSDYKNIRFRQGFGFQIRPKVSLSAHGFFGNLTIDRLISNDRRRYFGGGLSAEGDFTDRLTGEVDFSIESGSITGRLDRIGSPLPSETYVRPVVEMSLKYRIGKDIFPQLDYIRRTLVGNQIEGSPGVSNRFGLSVIKPFGRRKNWLVRASGNMEFVDWKSGNFEGDSAKILSAALTVQYRIQEWLHSSLLYSWQSFSYDDHGFFWEDRRPGVVDYGVNTITWIVRAGY